MDTKVRNVEEVLARLGSRSHGVVTRMELLAAGVSAEQIKARVRNGSLLVQYRGVYRVGHCAPSIEASYLAAVRACGKGAVLSRRAAAYLQGLIKGPPPPPEVTAPTERRVPGVKTSRSRDIEATSHRGVPVTTVARTLVDLAAQLSEEHLARACHEAGVRFRTTPKQVEAVLRRRPNTPGAKNLRRVLLGDVHVSLSQLEKRFLDLLREAGLPRPQTNKVASGRRVDCRWPEYGHRDVFEHPAAMMRELTELLA